MGNLVVIFYKRNKLSKAAGLKNQVLEKRSKSLGPSYRDTMTSMMVLARIFREEGLVDIAMLQDGALIIEGEIRGAEDKLTLLTLVELGSTVGSLGH